MIRARQQAGLRLKLPLCRVDSNKTIEGHLYMMGVNLVWSTRMSYYLFLYEIINAVFFGLVNLTLTAMLLVCTIPIVFSCYFSD